MQLIMKTNECWLCLCLKAVLSDLRVGRCHNLQLKFPVSTRHDKPSYSSFVCPVKRQILVELVTFFLHIKHIWHTCMKNVFRSLK